MPSACAQQEQLHELEGVYLLYYGKVVHSVKNKATAVTMQITDEYKFYFWNSTTIGMIFQFD